MQDHPPEKTEGAGKTGCALHPRSRVQNAHSKNAHEHTGSAETLRPSLRSGFTAYFELSPVTALFCHRRPRGSHRKNLTPASGCQDHTTSPSASNIIRLVTCRVHRIPPRVRDDREPPLCVGRDAQNVPLIWGREQSRRDAAFQHDGQTTHNTHARIARRVHRSKTLRGDEDCVDKAKLNPSGGRRTHHNSRRPFRSISGRHWHASPCWP